MTLLIETAIESAAIFAVAFGLLVLLRKQSAALRHWVLAAAFASAAVAPALGRLVPAWELPLPIAAAITDAARDASIAPTAAPARTSASGAPAQDGEAARRLTIADALWIMWLAGTTLALAVIAIGLVQLVRLRARARPITSGPWFDLAASISLRYGLNRPIALLEGAHPSMLVTWGLLRPKLILPVAAREWPAERARLVLSHELAHIRRGDWVVQLAAEFFKAVFWFNPLAWLACGRLRHESELAADDEVLNSGFEGAAYAEHLVEIARDLKQRRLWSAAPAIACSSSLERRVRAMLDARLNRRPLSRAASAAVLLALVATAVPVAGLAMAQQVFGSLSGSITDKTNGLIPGVTLVLTNVQTQQKYEVKTDSSGRYQFDGLMQGDYVFEAKLPGFAAFQGTLTVAGQSLQQDVTMEVGSLMETITVANSRSNPATAVVTSAPAFAKRPIPPCASSTTGPAIGGHVRPPRKVKDVRPLYSADLARQGIEGTVLLQARINIEGNVDEVTVVSTPNSELASAAIDAVKQWEFDATLLNCVAVPVNMKVTVNFTLKP
jgi:TonB family protein